MRLALNYYGQNIPNVRSYLQSEFLDETIRPQDRRFMRVALTSILSSIDTNEVRASLGFYRPGWTPKEAIEKGHLVLVDGSRLINQRNAQHYLFTQRFSHIMAMVNKRIPGDPKDDPVAVVMDEVYSLLSIPGMADEIGMLSPLYRSRKLELYVVLQALSQLSPELRKQIWSIGNMISFAISNEDEAEEIAKQLFRYNPTDVKMPAKTDTQHPIAESDRGQYIQIANHIQRMVHRECIMRRYTSERAMDTEIRYIERTRENPSTQIEETIEEIKDKLLSKRAVNVRDALEVIKARKLKSRNKPPNA
jgi:hypothetical protein